MLLEDIDWNSIWIMAKLNGWYEVRLKFNVREGVEILPAGGDSAHKK